jgi:uncharacterized protein (TIGR02246 family)
VLSAQESKPAAAEDPVHNELRALRDRAIEAFNKNDVDALLKYVHPNVVCTWQNGEVSRKHQGIRDYYAKMMQGPQRLVQSVKATADVDELAILRGPNNALAFGNLAEDFVLADGTSFNLSNRWTADLVKEEGRWLISGFHVSANLFDNPMLGIAIRRTAMWTGGIALAAGLLIGVVGAVLVSRARRRAR